jgi:hypothetical protein
MKWTYMIEKISAGDDLEELREQLNELGSGGWEAATSWVAPGINPEGKVFVLFKQQSK